MSKAFLYTLLDFNKKKQKHSSFLQTEQNANPHILHDSASIAIVRLYARIFLKWLYTHIFDMVIHAYF